jgi:hypothetical protein
MLITADSFCGSREAERARKPVSVAPPIGKRDTVSKILAPVF